MIKIKICVPYYKDIEQSNCMSGLLELQDCKEIDFVLSTAKGTDIGRARNHLINDHRSQKRLQKIEGNFDYILDIDTDIEFTLIDVLTAIAHDKDIVVLPYLRQGDPEQKQYEVHNFGTPIGNIVNYYDTTETGLKRVSSSGNGFRLSKVEVYEKTPYPWYRKLIIEDGEDQEETAVDVGFSIMVMSSGFDIWCDFDRPLKHELRANNKSKGPAMVNQQEDPRYNTPQNVDGEVMATINTLTDLAHAYKITKENEQRFKARVIELEAENAELRLKKA